MLHPLRRRRRRLGLLAATVLAFALIPAAAALADASYELDEYTSASFNEVDAFASGTPAEVPGPMRLVVRRAGAVVVNETGRYSTGTGFAFSSVESETRLALGDVVELYNPGTASSPSKTYTYTGRPSLDSCPVGGNKITGKVDPATFLHAGAFRPGAQSGDPNRNNPGVVVQSGDNYTATLQRNLAAGDVVFISGERQIDANFSVFRSESQDAGKCVPKATPAPPATTPPKPVVNPLDGVIEPLRKRDVKQGKNPAIINVRVTCSSASSIPCAGTVGAQTVRRFGQLSAFTSAKKKAKKKRVTLATKKFTLAPGKTKVVKLRLKKPALRLLKRQRSLKVRVSVVTKDAAGKRLATSRTLTLKYKAKKKARR